MVLAALQVCPHCQRGAEPMAGGPWAPSPTTRETPAAQASLTHPFHTHCIQISGAHSATWICLCHSLHLKAVGLWDIHTGSCRSGGIHGAHAAGIAQALPRCRTHFDIHEKSCFLSSSQCKPIGNFLPEQARLITTVNPLQAAKAGVLTPILAALLQQRGRLSSNTHGMTSTEVQSSFQSLLLIPQLPAWPQKHPEGARAEHFKVQDSRGSCHTCPAPGAGHKQLWNARGSLQCCQLIKSIQTTSAPSGQKEWQEGHATEGCMENSQMDRQSQLNCPPLLFSSELQL